MRKSCVILVALLTIIGDFYCYANDLSTKPLTGAQSFDLSPTEQSSLKAKYENEHSASAAFRLSQYYGLARSDSDKQMLWLKRGAELGDATSQYNLAYMLIEIEQYKDLKRGEFWLDKAEKSARQTQNSQILMLIPGLRADLKKY